MQETSTNYEEMDEYKDINELGKALTETSLYPCLHAPSAGVFQEKLSLRYMKNWKSIDFSLVDWRLNFRSNAG